MRVENKNFTPVSDTIIGSFSFKCEAFDYVFYSGKKFKVGTVYEISNDTFNLIQKIFAGKEGNTLQAGDKVYLMPNSHIGKNEFKIYLRSIKATLVEDVSKATVIAGKPNSETNDNQTRVTEVLIAPEFIKKYEGDNATLDFTKLSDPLNNSIIITDRAYNISSYIPEIYNVDSDLSYITGEGLNILYNIISRRLKVVTEEYLAENVNSGVQLKNYNVYRNIQQMLDSSNENDKESGLNILLTCDLTDAEYHLWKICFGSNILEEGYSKLKTNFRRKPEYITVNRRDRDGILEYLKSEDKLTQEVLDDVLEKVLVTNFSDISSKLDSDYFSICREEYGFKIKLKDCWKIKTKENENSKRDSLVQN